MKTLTVEFALNTPPPYLRADFEEVFFLFFQNHPTKFDFFKNGLNTPPLVKSQNRLQGGGGVFKANSTVTESFVRC